MREIKPITLYNIAGHLIESDDGKTGIFAYKDEGSRVRKRKIKGQDHPAVQSWKKIWFISVYRSSKHPDQTWRYAYAGGKYPFARIHLDPEQYVLLFDLIPFIYKEYFGVTCPWNSTPVEIKKEFKPKDEDDEVARLQRELAALR
jgi:hypothetical protein